jgi:bacteriophage HK97-gp10 putative tail-component
VSSNRLELNGLSELRAALRSLPADLAQNAAEFVDEATQHTASSLRQAYPLGETGKLRAGVQVSVTRTQFGVMGTVKSTSPHAHLWEFGTAVRQTRQGWNRGVSPSHHRDGLIPIAVRNRKTLNGHLVGLVRQAWFEVSGVL